MGEKVLCYGDFQMGKSTLSKYLARRFPRYLVWDPGYAWEWGTKDWEGAKEQFLKNGRVVFQPGTGDLESRFRDFCSFSLQQSNTCILIDEPRRYLLDVQEFDDWMRLGHKRNNTSIICPHSLWDLPHVSQQYSHLFIFRVTRAVDQNVLVQIVPKEACEWAKSAKQYAFWHQTPYGGRATTGLDFRGPKNAAALERSSEKPTA